MFEQQNLSVILDKSRNRKKPYNVDFTDITDGSEYFRVHYQSNLYTKGLCDLTLILKGVHLCEGGISNAFSGIFFRRTNSKMRISLTLF